jgi:hypothetical protein
MEFNWTQGALAEGLRRYDAGDFFTAHEASETVWLEAHEPDKTFLQGLIQVTAALHHLQRNNLLGAGRLLHAALRHLELYPPRFGGISVTVLCNDIRERIQAIMRTDGLPNLLDPEYYRYLDPVNDRASIGLGVTRYHRRDKRKRMSPTEPATRQHAFTGPVSPR